MRVTPDYDSDFAPRDSGQSRRHGITPEEKAGLLALQGGRCAICGTQDPGAADWHVDHDHRHHPGQYGCPRCIRGLLCRTCNLLLAMGKDDPQLIQAAAVYLKRSRQNQTW